jgi:hypothetical protein
MVYLTTNANKSLYMMEFLMKNSMEMVWKEAVVA